MKPLSICPDCSGFVPDSTACPHCKVAAPPVSRAMKVLKHSLRFVGLGTMAVTLSACYGGPVTEGIDSIEVTGGSAVVVGSNLQLTATATSYDGTIDDVTAISTWTTNSSSVATVTGGVVTGVNPGFAMIDASLDGVSGGLEVTVTAAFDRLSVSTTWAGDGDGPR